MPIVQPQEWTFYLCKVNDRLASIYVDLGLAPLAPVADKPWLLWVWVYFRQPRADGLSSSNEAPILFAVEDSLNSRLAEACGALLGGRITTEGRREFYYYAESTSRFHEAVSEAMSAFPDYKLDLGEKLDTSWRQFEDVLFPTREQMECIKNRDLLDVLLREGDELAVPRPVEYWLYFPSAELRSDFQQQAEAEGFEPGRYSTVEGDLPFCLTVRKVQKVEQTEIDRTVIQLLHLGKQCRGDYTGWETPVMSGGASETRND